jgi:hypothetical protein
MIRQYGADPSAIALLAAIHSALILANRLDSGKDISALHLLVGCALEIAANQNTLGFWQVNVRRLFAWGI